MFFVILCELESPPAANVRVAAQDGKGGRWKRPWVPGSRASGGEHSWWRVHRCTARHTLG